MIESISKIKSRIHSNLKRDNLRVQVNRYCKRFRKYSFSGTECKDFFQYEACITKLYHSIEKGLSYVDYRTGFGRGIIVSLVDLLKQYIANGYDSNSHCYRTALSCLKSYYEKNEEYGFQDEYLARELLTLPGSPNDDGGIVLIDKSSLEGIKECNYPEFILSRHSVRQFSREEVSQDCIKRAIELAQHTPSACNRQGWKTVVIWNRDTIQEVLRYQNGNRGFGDNITVLLLIVSDIRFFSRDREIFQTFIDGGMYAQSVINALHYEGIASIPLSASLSPEQEDRVRTILDLEESFIPIIFVGIGNYPEKIITTKSSRREASYISII